MSFIGKWVCNDAVKRKEMQMCGSKITWKYGGGGGPYNYKIENVKHNKFEVRSSQNQNVEFKYDGDVDEVSVIWY